MNGDGRRARRHPGERSTAGAAAKKHVILFLAANPSGTDRLALDREARSIHAELKRSGYRDRFDFVTRWAAEPLDLLRELRELKPTVIHVSGHGGTGTSETRGSAGGRNVVVETAPSGVESRGLYFHDQAGDAQVVSPAAIAEPSVLPGPPSSSSSSPRASPSRSPKRCWRTSTASSV
jgi:hypothetical protein